jgi:16S rRNA (cytosine967-C5)-methyltransferase
MSADPANARDIAVSALRDRAGNVGAHLDRLLGATRLAPADRAFARELALGVVRRRGTLEAVLRAFLEHPQRRLPSPIEEVLWVGLYQMLFLERVPEFAAVNEAVEQAGRCHHKRQAGLVNGVLRTVARNLLPRSTGPVPLERDVLPVAPMIHRRFQRPVFPDPRSAPREYLAAAFSLPALLADRWIERLGMDRAVQVAFHADVRAPLILRVNALRATVAGVLEALASAGVQASPHRNGCSVVLTEHAGPGELDVFKQGLVQPQDPSATAVVLAAEPKGGIKVLDFCAAPGTKTTHLAERMGNQGSIIAVDVSQERLRLIQENCRRLGVTIVSTQLAEQVGGLAPRSFDLVLADVPCSNTGVLSRRAEARWRFSEESLAALVKDQQFLAAAAAEFVAPGGRLIYSTCSMEPEECSGVIRRLVDRSGRLRLLREQLTLPAGADDATKWYDGGYHAVLQAGR